MRINRKHLGLLLASFIALSFNSHFAQAARKTKELLEPQKVFAFKKTDQGYVRLAQVKSSPVVVKKTGVTIDRKNIYIGGYVINTSDQAVNQVRIFPTFVCNPQNADILSSQLNHDELHLSPKETRRFVIMRPIAEVKALLENNVPLSDNCILNCRIL